MHKLPPEDETLDLEARCLLLESDPGQKEQGIRLLKQRYERPVMAFLADHFPDLPADERATAINDAWLEIYHRSIEGSLDMDRELAGLIFTVAKRRAIDARRRHATDGDRAAHLAEHVGDYLVGTSIGADWRMAAIREHTADISREFREFVKTLKAPQQRRVATVMADALPDWMTDREIADEVKRRFGVHLSTLEVKGAKQAMLSKLRALLKRQSR
ncbi:MAG TPA: hypothetical protein PLF88_02385 [Opitutaceae bacterium]|nr:hypothetical protein [Opitutaceae bacterium]HRJ46198.1 hypothetical protein [Opitutaceae bacterium]